MVSWNCLFYATLNCLALENLLSPDSRTHRCPNMWKNDLLSWLQNLLSRSRKSQYDMEFPSLSPYKVIIVYVKGHLNKNDSKWLNQVFSKKQLSLIEFQICGLLWWNREQVCWAIWANRGIFKFPSEYGPRVKNKYTNKQTKNKLPATSDWSQIPNTPTVVLAIMVSDNQLDQDFQFVKDILNRNKLVNHPSILHAMSIKTYHSWSQRDNSIHCWFVLSETSQMSLATPFPVTPE